MGTGVLAGSVALAGCSSSGSSAGGTIPPMNSASAGSSSTAEASASGGEGSAGASGTTAAADGPVTAESLSDPDLGYTVVSIPEGLDATQTKVLQDYIEYDKTTWRLWSSGGKDKNGIEDVATGSSLANLLSYATKMQQDGIRINPSVKVAVDSVTLNSDDKSAYVNVCMDDTESTTVDTQGNTLDQRIDYVRKPIVISMISESDNKWLTNEESHGQVDSCSIEG